MKKVRIGVIGLSMGRHHVIRLVQEPNCEVAAICDLSKERLDRVTEEQGIVRQYRHYEKMIEDGGLDAVFVALPNKLHAPVSIHALQAGLHVYCEKPMAMNAMEGERMKATAEKAGKNLMIGFNQRFSPVPWLMRRKIEKGELGGIYFGRTCWHRQRGIPGMGGWFTTKKLSGGGPLIDIGVHRLDLALWLMGYPEPVAVCGAEYCKIANEKAREAGKKFDVEDMAVGMIKFDNGATLILEASWAMNIRDTYLQTVLCGDKGGLTYAHYRKERRGVAEFYKEKKGEIVIEEIDASRTRVPTVQREFIRSIIEKRPPLCTAEQGIKVMRILDGIYKSAETGREVRYSGKRR